ncbi:MAG: pyocin knob domain-containing protein, partial [Enterobacteriaceae bacterium]
MRKISDFTTTATPEGEFTDGNVAAGVAPTVLPAGYFNVLQREIIAILETNGIKLNPKDDTQVAKLINSIKKGADDSLKKAANLTDVADKGKARTALGLGALAVKDDLKSTEVLPVEIGDAKDLNTFTTPGTYYQHINARAEKGNNYPEAIAGALLVYRAAGIVQEYRVYNAARVYIRTVYNNAWTPWARQYNTLNIPTAAEVGALPVTGGNVAGFIRVEKNISIGRVGDGVFNGSIPAINIGDSDSGFTGPSDGRIDIYANNSMIAYI